MSNNTPVLWEPRDIVRLPADASVADVAARAQQLSKREAQQVTRAFEDGSYEMGSTFVWARTMAGLKRQLASLGIEFIAEILDRPDIKPGSEVAEVLTDYDAVQLAEDLGMFGSSHAMRLRHALETIHHFSDPPDDADHEGMTRQEAEQALRTCVQTVLGHQQLTFALEFAGFRRRLETETLPDDWAAADDLESLPYFFRRTILRVLIAGVKTSSGAKLEHLLANLNLLVPSMWPGLMDPDRYTVGRLYSDLHSDGQNKAASGVRSALLKVKGFDYVPESLRSRTFIEAASKLLATHLDWDNFHNEPAPMRALAALGTSIPSPAFPKCMTAVISVRIGNHYGVSFAAQPDANRLLASVTSDRWKYFLEQCLPADEVLLRKLTDSEVASRWCDLVTELDRLQEAPTDRPSVQTFVEDSMEHKLSKVRRYAESLLKRLG